MSNQQRVTINCDVAMSSLNSIYVPPCKSPAEYTLAWRWLLVANDAAMMFAASFIAASLVDHERNIHVLTDTFFPLSILFVFSSITTFFLCGLYRQSLAPTPRDEYYFALVALVLGFIPQFIFYNVVSSLLQSRTALLLTLGIAVLLVGTARSIIHTAWQAFLQRQERLTDEKVLRRRQNTGFKSTILKISKPSARLVKRTFDFTFALIGLLLSSPIMLVAALFIFLGSGLPILFRQERVGRDGRVFQVLKFRTMRRNSGSQWVHPGDRRITSVGGVLRRFSIDELPQLLNVLRGEMSLVGPRPEMLEFEQAFAQKVPLYDARRLALPGISGWAQVNMRRNLSPDDINEVLAYDLFYIKQWSLLLDLTILVKTATEMVFHQGV